MGIFDEIRLGELSRDIPYKQSMFTIDRQF